MLVVKLGTYRRWLKPKESKQRNPGRPRTAEATVNLVMQFASESLVWGYRKLHGEFKKLGIINKPFPARVERKFSHTQTTSINMTFF